MHSRKLSRLGFLLFMAVVSALAYVGLTVFQEPPRVSANGPNITEVEVSSSPVKGQHLRCWGED